MFMKQLPAKVLVSVPPKLMSALELIAKETGRTRSDLIRDALYELVWRVRREGQKRIRRHVRSTLQDVSGKMLGVVNSKLVFLDEHGLTVDDVPDDPSLPPWAK